MGEHDMRGDPSNGSVSRDWLDRFEDFEDKARLDLADLVHLKGHLLAPDERSLLEAYLKGSNSLRQIARLTGVKPSSAWRRVRRLAKRLHASANLTCLEKSRGLTVDELAIVKDHAIRGLTIGDISRSRNLSYYRVRNIILMAKALTRADCAPSGSGTGFKAGSRRIQGTESQDGSST
jgi:hypothetical protein